MGRRECDREEEDGEEYEEEGGEEEKGEEGVWYGEGGVVRDGRWNEEEKGEEWGEENEEEERMEEEGRREERGEGVWRECQALRGSWEESLSEEEKEITEHNMTRNTALIYTSLLRWCGFSTISRERQVGGEIKNFFRIRLTKTLEIAVFMEDKLVFSSRLVYCISSTCPTK